MSEPLDKLVSSFYLALPLPPQEKPRRQTIFSCLAALDKLRKTTDISALLTASGGKKWSSIEVLTYLVEHVPSRELQSPLRKKMLEAYKRAGGRTSTYLRQILVEPFRKMANWGRYRIKGKALAQEKLCRAATHLLSTTIERGTVENKQPDQIFEEIKDQCSKQEKPIQGASSFFQDFRSELDKNKEEITQWVETIQTFLSKNSEDLASAVLNLLQKNGMKQSIVTASSDTKRKWKDRIEYAFTSKAFAKESLKAKQKIFEIYQAIGGTYSPDLCEAFCALTLAKSDEEIEESIHLLQEKEVQEKCSGMRPDAQRLMLNRVENLIDSTPFVHTKISERIGLLRLYQAIGGKEEKYIQQFVLTCARAKTDHDSALCTSYLLAVVGKDPDMRAKVQNEIERMFSSAEFSTSGVRGRLATIAAYRAIEGTLETCVEELLSTVTQAKKGENVEGCIQLLSSLTKDPAAEADLQSRLEKLILSDNFANTAIHARVAILNLYRARGGSFLTCLSGLLVTLPKEGDEEEWARQVLVLLQERGMLPAIAGLHQPLQVTLQLGLLHLFETQAFTSASSGVKDIVLGIFKTIKGDPATYFWENACAHSSGTESSELLSKHRDYAIASLKTALNRAVILNPSVDYILEQLRETDTKHPSSPQLVPVFEKLLEQHRTLIESLLAEESNRRPSPTRILLEAYTPTAEFTAQLDNCLYGSEEEFAGLVQQMKDSLSWPKQFWVAWRALTVQPPITEARIKEILDLFEKNGFPKVPGYFQTEIMNLFMLAHEKLDLPPEIRKYLQESFS
jgi:hypothetical protein